MVITLKEGEVSAERRNKDPGKTNNSAFLLLFPLAAEKKLTSQ